LFEELEYFLGTPSEDKEGSKCGNQLACRVS
jgi:cohesin complex subunit SA-1/2